MASDSSRVPGSGSVGGAEPRRGETPPTGAARRRRRSCRRYSVEQKVALIEAYEASGQDMRAFCAEQRISTASLCTWRRLHTAQGEAGLSVKGHEVLRSWGTRSFTHLAW